MCPLAFAPVPPLAASTYVSSSRPSPPYTSSDALPAVAFAPFQQPADSPLRASGRACLASGAMALFRAEEAQAPHPDADAQALLDAAERSGIGVHVRPTKGAACVFWTMGKEGVDPSSWHNGAKVLYGGGGKWIAQKFKELPIKYRKALPLALPDELAPPPMP